MEVVLALGVFAGGILLVCGLLPGLLSQSRDSWQDTRAAHIARQIITDLRGGGGREPSLVQSGGFADSQLVAQQVDLSVAGSYQVSYSAEGQAITTEDPAAVLTADIQLSPVANRPGLCDVRIEIRPRGAPAGSGFPFSTRVAHFEIRRAP